MDNVSFDKLIVDYLKKEFSLDKETFFSVKLALLDTIACIFDASASTQPVSFATTGKHSKIDNPFEFAKYITYGEILENFLQH